MEIEHDHSSFVGTLTNQVFEKGLCLYWCLKKPGGDGHHEMPRFVLFISTAQNAHKMASRFFPLFDGNCRVEDVGRGLSQVKTKKGMQKMCARLGSNVS